MSAFEKLARIARERSESLAVLRRVESESKAAKTHMDAARRAHVAAVELGVECQNEVSGYVESLVGRCLDDVFGPGFYAFRLLFESKASRSTVSMRLERGGIQMDPLDAAGGGVVDVVSFAMRLASILLSGRRRLMLLDEPFKFLSSEYRSRVGDLLAALSEDFGFQFILVTHFEELQIGKTIKCPHPSKRSGRPSSIEKPERNTRPSGRPGTKKESPKRKKSD